MKTQPEALRLAELLDGTHVVSASTNNRCAQAAAELRRLHEENSALRREVTNRNRRALDGDEAVSALDRVHAYYEGLEQANQELLEALKLVTAMCIRHDFVGWDQMPKARAALAKHGGAV
jgi:hypothetical protein